MPDRKKKKEAKEKCQRKILNLKLMPKENEKKRNHPLPDFLCVPSLPWSKRLLLHDNNVGYKIMVEQ